MCNALYAKVASLKCTRHSMGSQWRFWSNAVEESGECNSANMAYFYSVCKEDQCARQCHMLLVTDGHSNWYHSKSWVRFPIHLP